MHTYRLMTPGPVALSPSSRKILSEQMLHHRTPLFTKILKETWTYLQNIYQTKQPVLLLGATGSGAMEASMINLLSPNDSFLYINGGKFGARWGSIGKAFNLNATEYKVEWGQNIDLNDLERKLKQLNNCKALFIQSCETSTGVKFPLKEIAELTKKYNLLFVVDGITAVGAYELPMDELGIDVLIGGGQKALGTLPGISYISLSEKAWEYCHNSTSPRFYFDLRKELKANQSGQTFFSSCVSHIRVLHNELQLIQQKGLASHFKEVSLRATATRSAMEIYQLKQYTTSPANSLSVFSLPSDVDGVKFRDHIEDKYNMILIGGQDELKGKVIRIGHMGYIPSEDVISSVELIGRALNDFDHKVEIEPAINITKNILSGSN